MGVGLEWVQYVTENEGNLFTYLKYFDKHVIAKDKSNNLSRYYLNQIKDLDESLVYLTFVDKFELTEDYSSFLYRK